MSTNKYARRWGYDHEASEFRLLIDGSAVLSRAVVTLKSESGQEARQEIVTTPGEHRIPFLGIKENEWIQGQLLVAGCVVDEFGVRTAIVTCPHCGNRIDKV